MPPRIAGRARGYTRIALVGLLAAWCGCAGEQARATSPAAPSEATLDAPRERAQPPALEEATAPPPPAGEVRPERAAKSATEAALESLLALDPSASTSIGGPNDGSVRGAVPLPLEGPGFRFNPRRRPEARFGTVEMVQAIVRAARAVHEAFPGGELLVNDLGLEAGGPIAQHGSHRSGRDVDVLFHLLDAEGRPMPSVGAPLDPAGEGVDFRDLAVAEDDVPVRLDAARTFRFVRALLEDERAAVQRIFVAEHLRALLLAEARASSAPLDVIARFEEITCQPGSPHDDHLHIRFFCAPDDVALGCEDERPIYAWHRRALAALGATPVLARPRPDRPRAPTTSPEEARQRAGTLHPRVVEWLERREAWLDPPRTGRRYCR